MTANKKKIKFSQRQKDVAAEALLNHIRGWVPSTKSVYDIACIVLKAIEDMP